MIVHMDDFLCTFHEDFNREILENLFVWGSVVIVDKLTPGSYRGKEITLVEKGGRITYKVTQKSFIDGMTSGSIARGRSKEDEKLTAEEWKEYSDQLRDPYSGSPRRHGLR